MLTGETNGEDCISLIYRNDNELFTDINAELTGVCNGDVAWGNYDDDGDLDILLTGRTAQYDDISRIYRNDNDGAAFTEVGAGLPGLRHGAASWVDYDSDGDLDIHLTGRRWGGPEGWVLVSGVFRNNDGSFTNSAIELPTVFYGDVAWGDYNNDGEQDVLLTGYTSFGGTRISHIYRNDGGVFTNTAQLTPASLGSAAWGDYDNDGDLDILLAGWGEDYIARVYRSDRCLYLPVVLNSWSRGLTLILPRQN